MLPSPPIKEIIIPWLLQFPVSELPATTFFWPKPKWRIEKAFEIDFHPMRIIFSYQKQIAFPSFYLCLRILIPPPGWIRGSKLFNKNRFFFNFFGLTRATHNLFQKIFKLPLPDSLLDIKSFVSLQKGITV